MIELKGPQDRLLHLNNHSDTELRIQRVTMQRQTEFRMGIRLIGREKDITGQCF